MPHVSFPQIAGSEGFSSFPSCRTSQTSHPLKPIPVPVSSSSSRPPSPVFRPRQCVQRRSSSASPPPSRRSRAPSSRKEGALCSTHAIFPRLINRRLSTFPARSATHAYRRGRDGDVSTMHSLAVADFLALTTERTAFATGTQNSAIGAMAT